MTNDRLLSALAMCRGAGKLKIGFDASAEAAAANAPLIVTASDAAPRTLRNIALCCTNKTRLAALDRTQSEIEKIVGRRFAVAAVCDENFANLISQHLPETAL